MSTVERKVFYGIFVSALPLAAAADSLKYSYRSILAINLISSRYLNGTLETNSAEIQAIKKIPIEVWDKIKVQVVDLAIRIAKKKILREIWGNCECYEAAAERGKIYKTKKDYPLCINLPGDDCCADMCEDCIDTSVEFYKHFITPKRFIMLKALEKRSGLKLVSGDVLNHPRQFEIEHGFLALTIMHKESSKLITSTPLESATNECSRARDADLELIPMAQFPSTKEEEIEIHQRFKSFVKKFNLQGMHSLAYTSPFGFEKLMQKCGSSKSEEAIKGYVPRWIQWEVKK